MIEIRPHFGLCRGVEADTGIDGVWLTEAGTTRMIGVRARDEGAPVQLFDCGYAPAILFECSKVAGGAVVIEPVPAIQEKEDDDDEEEDVDEE